MRISKIQFKYIIAILLISIIAIFTYQFFINSSENAYQDIKFIDTEKATLSSISQNINLIGTVKASKSSLLLAQENGIFEIIIKPSSIIKEGELFARIINNDIKEIYELSLAAESISKTEFNRAARLLKANAFSKQQYENKQKELINAKKDLSSAQISLAKLELRTPFDGIIGAYKIQTGAYLQIGDPILTIYDPKQLRVEFDIPSSAISSVQNEQKLKIFEKEYKLTHVQKTLDEESHMSPAYCDIECPTCIIGSNVNVDLTLIEKEQVIVIPFEAIFLNEGKSSIYIIKDNKAEIRNITLGIRAKDLVEVTNNLEAGEEFVTKNPSRLYPGVAVKTKE